MEDFSWLLEIVKILIGFVAGTGFLKLLQFWRAGHKSDLEFIHARYRQQIDEAYARSIKVEQQYEEQLNEERALGRRSKTRLLAAEDAVSALKLQLTEANIKVIQLTQQVNLQCQIQQKTILTDSGSLTNPKVSQSPPSNTGS